MIHEALVTRRRRPGLAEVTMWRKPPARRKAKLWRIRHPESGSAPESLVNPEKSIIMIRYLTLAAALASAFTAEPLYAKQQHARGGGGKHAPAVAVQRSAPRARTPIARS